MLFRTTLPYFEFYTKHPFVGSNYGDFSVMRQWTESKPIIVEITQDRGAICGLEARQFIPPDDNAIDSKGNPIYMIPWAIADPESAVKSINKYIDEAIPLCLDDILDNSDHLVWDVFHYAYRLSIFPCPVGIQILLFTTYMKLTMFAG
jgi:hypothetical protein